MENHLENSLISIVQNENDHTELLKSLFKFESFRNKFLELTELELNKNLIHFEHFSTQSTLNNYGRPDIVLRNDELELFFEVKVINSHLTGNQPNGYYDELKKSNKKTKGLFFIVPKFYIGLDTLRKKIKEVSNTNDNIKTKIIFWDNIIEICKDESQEQLFQYHNFLKTHFHIEPIRFNSKEIEIMFNNETPKGLFKIIQLVYDANQMISFHGSIIKRLSDDFLNEKHYGFSLKLPNLSNELFIGVWGKYWEETGNPICFAVQKNPDNSKAIEIFNKISIELKFPKPILFAENEQNSYLVTYFEKEVFENDLFLDKIGKISKIISQEL